VGGKALGPGVSANLSGSALQFIQWRLTKPVDPMSCRCTAMDQLYGL
jgi:hypothetical protein